jgi:BirA family transcriptional regulator, biotin operon repressor / biotin---[acetyl-CoA-carboxylase] ligase
MPINHIPTKLFHLESVDSTNNYVANLVRNGEIESGSVVLADFQSEGRGQRGTKWQAAAGENMTASLFVQWPDLLHSEQFRISMLVSLGVVRFLVGYGVSAQIKWPNDLWVRGNKIAGMLIENQVRGQRVVSSIIGIGLNVNQQEFEDGLHATSMSRECNRTYSVRLITMELFQTIGQVIQELQDYPFNELHRLYLNKLFGYGHPISVEFTENQLIAEIEITGVTEEGLLVYLLDGEIGKADLKEIRFLR